ncbi:unnamed protein product [Phyllotreta striolata]|uniref:Uncharacterized protein n=1 Tax=Phyllotreta striolata TaxID=444603 RepID=A0A9N9TMU3_PHYSR|nr:unnamed protein product [Phyllotreta striolata]
MVGSNGTMIAIRLVRSKLRKRQEDEEEGRRPDAGRSGVVLEAAPPPVQQLQQLRPVYDNNQPVQQLQQARELELQLQEGGYGGQFLWTQPPPQVGGRRCLYNNNQELVQNLPSASSSAPASPVPSGGFARGFRKNLGGKWRRLVRRGAGGGGCKTAPSASAYAIPAELKPQLKQIYVY